MMNNFIDTQKHLIHRFNDVDKTMIKFQNDLVIIQSSFQNNVIEMQSAFINKMQKIMQLMKLKISKATENAFEKIAEKVITLNEIVIQNSSFSHRETLFSEHQNSSIDASFDHSQR